MDLSDGLAGLNVARYQAWSPRFTASNSQQAVLAFNGDVYDGLQANTLAAADLEWAQEHLCILSGLYGVLRPLDWMQPYRLEMGTSLAGGPGAQPLPVLGHADRRLPEPAAGSRQDAGGGESGVAGVRQGGRSAGAQGPGRRLRVRGMERRRLQDHQFLGQEGPRTDGPLRHRSGASATPRQLQRFASEGYSFDPGASRPDRMVFRRRMDQ